MGKIIVGFDFSSGSAYAVDLSIDIANRWHDDIRLVYVKGTEEDETPIRAEIERRNAGVAHLLKGIKLEYTIRQGNVAQQLAQQAEEDQADLIVVGTTGMSGLQTNWIGVNTYRTIAESTVPVLTIREDFDFNKKLEKIIVPLDSTPETRQKVPVAAKFAQVFGSEIVIVGLYTSSSNDIHSMVNSYVSQVQNYLENEGVGYSTKLIEVPKNLTLSTLEYADEIDADMIVIMTEQEKSITSFLLGSYAQQMLHLSKRPILTIRPEEVFSVSK